MPNHLKSVTLCHTNEQTLILFNLNQIMNYEGFKFEGLHLVTVPETYSTMVSVAKCDDKNRQKEFIKGLWGAFKKTDAFAECNGDNDKEFNTLYETAHFWLSYMGYSDKEVYDTLAMYDEYAADLATAQ